MQRAECVCVVPITLSVVASFQFPLWICSSLAMYYNKSFLCRRRSTVVPFSRFSDVLSKCPSRPNVLSICRIVKVSETVHHRKNTSVIDHTKAGKTRRELDSVFIFLHSVGSKIGKDNSCGCNIRKSVPSWS